MLPEHTLENAAAAAAACYAAGLPWPSASAGSRDVRFARGRGEVMWLPGLCLIDDTYNANPAAVRAALDDLVRLAARAEGPAGGRPGRHAGAGSGGGAVPPGGGRVRGATRGAGALGRGAACAGDGGGFSGALDGAA